MPRYFIFSFFLWDGAYMCSAFIFIGIFTIDASELIIEEKSHSQKKPGGEKPG
jgi:hypothetical protein